MKKKTWAAALGVALAGLALFVAASNGASEAAIELDGTAWYLTDLAGQGVVEGSEVTLEFAEGRITGRAGCNGFGSEYELDGGDLVIGEQMATTMMWCEGLMDQEAAYTQALIAAQSVTLEDGELTVHTANGDLLFAALLAAE